MLLKHVLLKMMNLKIFDNEKLNKELKKNDIFNVTDTEFQKRILTEKKKLARICCFDDKKMNEIISRNQ